MCPQTEGRGRDQKGLEDPQARGRNQPTQASELSEVCKTLPVLLQNRQCPSKGKWEKKHNMLFSVSLVPEKRQEAGKLTAKS